MDIVEEIKKCETDEELRELSQEAIEVFTEKAQEENLCTEYLGDNIGIYPKLIVGEEAYNANNVWNGYIPKGVKVNYARYKAEGQDQYTHLGYYYYMDDDDYVFDFFKLIHDEEDIEDDNDIIMVVQSFIEEKFSKCVNPTSRQVMHMLFHKADNTVCPPAHEHKFSDFYREYNFSYSVFTHYLIKRATGAVWNGTNETTVNLCLILYRLTRFRT